MKYWRLIFKNLVRSKRRTILTILSIAVSLFIFAAMISMPVLFNQVLTARASSLRIACHNKAGFVYALPEAYKQRIATTPHVEAVAAQSWFGGIYHDPTEQFPNFAIDHEEIEKIYPDYGITPEALAAFKGERTATLVGLDTMRRFGWKLGDHITLRGTIYPINVTLHIVGTLGDTAPPNFLMFRRDYLEEATGRKGFVGMYWLSVDRSESVPMVIASLDESFANSDAETQSESEAAFLSNFLSSARSFFTMAELFGIIVVFTIGLVAANTAAMSIRERRSEIAVMRSIGFTSGTILSMLLGESALIGIAGGVLGVAMAAGALRFFGMNVPSIGALRISGLPPAAIGYSLIVALLIGVVSGFVPARAAARQNIVDALRMVA
jgi:putative ABC transport system permease protein